MMKHQFLKVTFMALCLSASSFVYAMDPEDNAGKYFIKQNSVSQPSSGSITIQHGDENDLILEEFKITGGHYLKVLNRTNAGLEADLSPFGIRHRQLVNFILSGTLRDVELKPITDDDKESQYGGSVEYEGQNIFVNFRKNKNSPAGWYTYTIALHTLIHETPEPGSFSVSPIETFMLVKEGGAQHDYMKSRPGYAE